MSINKAIILGFVGKEPETRILGDITVTNFSIATTEKYKDKSGEYKESTQWHKIACFGKLSEIANQIVHKGSQIYIEGKIVTRSWKDTNGVEKWITEIKADTLQVLNKIESSEAKQYPTTKPSDMLNDMDQDVPF
jgi:single-strand DNA-binding protein